MSDLPSALRDLVATRGVTIGHDDVCVVCAAADEIERLRARVERLEAKLSDRTIRLALAYREIGMNEREGGE